MLYKLTDKHGRTRAGEINETQWGSGVTHSAQGAPDQPLCTDGWIHAYEHPLIAVIMNPIHASLRKPRLWAAAGEIGAREGQIKCGCRTLTTIREIPVPKISMEQKLRFAIGIGMLSWNNFAYHQWARNWLSGADRTTEAAEAAEAEARMARTTEAVAAAADAAWTAAWTAEAAEASARVARTAEAMETAVRTTAWVAEAMVDFDLFAIAEWAMTEETFEQLKKRMKGQKK